MAEDSAEDWSRSVAAVLITTDADSSARAKAWRGLARMQPPSGSWSHLRFRELTLLCARDTVLEMRRLALHALGNIAAVDPTVWCTEACQSVLIESAQHSDKHVAEKAWRCVSKLVENHGETMWADDRVRSPLIAGAAGRFGKSQLVRTRCLATLKALATRHSSTWRQMWQEAGVVLRSAAMDQGLEPQNRRNALQTLDAVAHDTNRREMWADLDFRALLLAGKIFDPDCTRVIFDIYAKLATDPQTAEDIWGYFGTKAMFNNGVRSGSAEALRALVTLSTSAQNQATIWQDMKVLLLEIIETRDSTRKELAMEAVANLSECRYNGHEVWFNSYGNSSKTCGTSNNTWLMDLARTPAEVLSANPESSLAQQHKTKMKALALRTIANSMAQGQDTDTIFRTCRLAPVTVLEALLSGSEDESLTQETRACALGGVASIVRTVDHEDTVKDTVRRASLQLADGQSQALLREAALRVLERAQVSISNVWLSNAFRIVFISCMDEASPIGLRVRAFRVLAVLVSVPQAISTQIWLATAESLFVAASQRDSLPLRYLAGFCIAALGLNPHLRDEVVSTHAGALILPLNEEIDNLSPQEMARIRLTQGQLETLNRGRHLVAALEPHDVQDVLEPAQQRRRHALEPLHTRLGALSRAWSGCRSSMLRVTASSENLFEDFLAAASAATSRGALGAGQRLQVTFRGERGVDAGGLSRQAFADFGKALATAPATTGDASAAPATMGDAPAAPATMGDASPCLFKVGYGNVLVPTSAEALMGQNGSFRGKASVVPDLSAKILERYEACGVVCGLALTNDCHLGVSFSTSFVRLALGGAFELRPERLAALLEEDPESWLAQHWAKFLDTPLVELGLEDAFTFVTQEAEAPLAEGDAGETAVTDANKQLYLDRLLEHRLVSTIRQQARAFKKGLDQVTHHSSQYCLARLLDVGEVNEQWRGKELDDDALGQWRQKSVLEHQDPSIPVTATLWWEWLREQPSSRRSEVLQFATGATRLPVDLSRWIFRISREAHPPIISATAANRLDGDAMLATAATCGNAIRLPRWQDKQELERGMRMSLMLGGGYGFV